MGAFLCCAQQDLQEQALQTDGHVPSRYHQEIVLLQTFKLQPPALNLLLGEVQNTRGWN